MDETSRAGVPRADVETGGVGNFQMNNMYMEVCMDVLGNSLEYLWGSVLPKTHSTGAFDRREFTKLRDSPERDISFLCAMG